MRVEKRHAAILFKKKQLKLNSRCWHIVQFVHDLSKWVPAFVHRQCAAINVSKTVQKYNTNANWKLRQQNVRNCVGMRVQNISLGKHLGFRYLLGEPTVNARLILTCSKAALYAEHGGACQHCKGPFPVLKLGRGHRVSPAGGWRK